MLLTKSSRVNHETQHSRCVHKLSSSVSSLAKVTAALGLSGQKLGIDADRSRPNPLRLLVDSSKAAVVTALRRGSEKCGGMILAPFSKPESGIDSGGLEVLLSVLPAAAFLSAVSSSARESRSSLCFS